MKVIPEHAAWRRILIGAAVAVAIHSGVAVAWAQTTGRPAESTLTRQFTGLGGSAGAGTPYTNQTAISGTTVGGRTLQLGLRASF